MFHVVHYPFVLSLDEAFERVQTAPAGAVILLVGGLVAILRVAAFARRYVEGARPKREPVHIG